MSIPPQPVSFLRSPAAIFWVVFAILFLLAFGTGLYFMPVMPEGHAAAEAYAAVRTTLPPTKAQPKTEALEAKLLETDAAIQTISNRLEELQAPSASVKIAVDASRQSPSDGSPPLRKVRQQLAVADKIYKTLQSQLDQMESMEQDQFREALPGIVTDSVLADLLSQRQAAEQQLAQATESHPGNGDAAQLQSLIAQINGEMDDRAARIVIGLENEVASRKSARDALAATVAKASAPAALSTAHDAAAPPDSETSQPLEEDAHELQRLLNSRQMLTAQIEQDKMDHPLEKSSMVAITNAAAHGNVSAKSNQVKWIVTNAILGIVLGGASGSIAAFIVMRMEKRGNRPASGETA